MKSRLKFSTTTLTLANICIPPAVKFIISMLHDAFNTFSSAPTRIIEVQLFNTLLSYTQTRMHLSLAKATRNQKQKRHSSLRIRDVGKRTLSVKGRSGT